MSITIGGKTFSTLDDQFSINGSLIKAAYVNGNLVYPAAAVDVAFVCGKNTKSGFLNVMVGGPSIVGVPRYIAIAENVPYTIDYAYTAILDLDMKDAQGRQLIQLDSDGIIAPLHSEGSSYYPISLLTAMGAITTFILAVNIRLGAVSSLNNHADWCWPILLTADFDLEYGDGTLGEINKYLQKISSLELRYQKNPGETFNMERTNKVDDISGYSLIGVHYPSQASIYRAESMCLCNTGFKLSNDNKIKIWYYDNTVLPISTTSTTIVIAESYTSGTYVSPIFEIELPLGHVTRTNISGRTAAKQDISSSILYPSL